MNARSRPEIIRIQWSDRSSQNQHHHHHHHRHDRKTPAHPDIALRHQQPLRRAVFGQHRCEIANDQHRQRDRWAPPSAPAPSPTQATISGSTPAPNRSPGRSASAPAPAPSARRRRTPGSARRSRSARPACVRRFGNVPDSAEREEDERHQSEQAERYGDGRHGLFLPGFGT